MVLAAVGIYGVMSLTSPIARVNRHPHGNRRRASALVRLVLREGRGSLAWTVVGIVGALGAHAGFRVCSMCRRDRSIDFRVLPLVLAAVAIASAITGAPSARVTHSRCCGRIESRGTLVGAIVARGSADAARRAGTNAASTAANQDVHSHKRHSVS